MQLPGDEFLFSVLTEEDLTHYRRFLGSALPLTPPVEERWQWNATVTGREEAPARPEPRRALVTPPWRRRVPVLVPAGIGPDRCSSSQALAPRPLMCWDVCGYYSRLGVHWKATRRQLREAYLARGAALAGKGNADLAYVLSQLLNPEIRREYDAVPLGGFFLRDRDTVAALKRAAHRVARTRMRYSVPEEAQEEEQTPEDLARQVLREWGFRLGPGSDEPGRQRPETAASQAPEQPTRTWSPPWRTRWTWYADRECDSTDRTWDERVAALERWQLLLVRAFSAKSARVEFGVGLSADAGFTITPSYRTGTLVILLGPGEPTQQLADEAVTEWGFA